MTRKRAIIIVLVLAAVVAAGAAYYLRWSDGRSAAGSLVLYGNVDIREADLAFNIIGRIERMLVEEGDTVEPGQLLAVLETEIYDAEVQAAKARVGAQQAALDRLLAGSRPEEIKVARARRSAIEVELEDSRATLARTETLATDRFASQQKLDTDRARVRNLEAQLRAAEEELSLAIQGPRKEDIAEARARLNADEAELTLALRRLAYTELHAKERGVVKARIMEPGAVVLANAPVYSIALSDPVWVRTYVPEPDLGRIRPGMKAEIVSDSRPDRPFEGWVGFISPVAEFTPKTVETPELRTSLVYRLRVYVKNPGSGLRQGMPVTVRLLAEGDADGAGKAASE